MNHKKSLTTDIPYFALDDGLVLLTNGSLVSGIKIMPPSFVSKADNEIHAMKMAMMDALRLMPAGYQVQIIYDRHVNSKKRLSEYADALGCLGKEHLTLKEFCLKEFEKEPGFETDIYIFIASQAVKAKGFFDFLKFKNSSGQKGSQTHSPDFLAGHKHNVKLLKDITKNVITSLCSVALTQARELSLEEFKTLLIRLLNPDQILQEDKRHFTGGHPNYLHALTTLREELVLTPFVEHAECLKAGRVYYKTLSLKIPPRETNVSDLETILNGLNLAYMFSFSFSREETHQINSMLEGKQRKKFAIEAGQNNPKISTSVSKADVEQALTDQKEMGFDWHYASLSILLSSNEPDTLKEQADLFQKVFAGIDATLIQNNYAHMDVFKGMLPGSSLVGANRFLFSSMNVSDLAPLSGTDVGTSELAFFIKTHRDTPFRFSTFSTEFNNWNQVVVGKIGSGKSFLVNTILNRSLMSMPNPEVMILDLGGSFARTSRFWGGDYIAYDLNDPKSGINPLPAKGTLFEGGCVDLTVLDFTIHLIMMMLKIPEHQTLDVRVLRTALLYLYDKFDQPVLADLYQVLSDPSGYIHGDEEDLKIAMRLTKLLQEFVRDGAYSRIFSGDSKMSLDNPFFCFDFLNAGQNPFLREIATYVVGGYIYRNMIKNRDPKFIIIDEFSSTMRHATGQKFCEMIAKNCRKHGASFVAISQQIEDFQDNTAARTVYLQSNFKWFLKMDDHVERFQSALNLSDIDVANIRGIKQVPGKYSETYLFYGDHKALLKIEPDPYLYWLSTTDPRDLRILSTSIEQNDGDFRKALQSLSQSHPNGVFHGRSRDAAEVA